jgi:hypothetical protein
MAWEEAALGLEYNKVQHPTSPSPPITCVVALLLIEKALVLLLLLLAKA